MKKLSFGPLPILLVIFTFLSNSICFAESDVKFYRVKRGDTLSRISMKYFHNAKKWKEILKYNRIDDPHWIYVGDILYIPSEAILNKISKAKSDEEIERIIDESKGEKYGSKKIVKMSITESYLSLKNSAAKENPKRIIRRNRGIPIRIK